MLVKILPCPKLRLWAVTNCTSLVEIGARSIGQFLLLSVFCCCRVHEEKLVHRVHRLNVGNRDYKDPLDQLVHKDDQVHKDNQVQTANLDNKVH